MMNNQSDSNPHEADAKPEFWDLRDSDPALWELLGRVKDEEPRADFVAAVMQEARRDSQRAWRETWMWRSVAAGIICALSIVFWNLQDSVDQDQGNRSEDQVASEADGSDLRDVVLLLDALDDGDDMEVDVDTMELVRVDYFGK